MATVQYEWIWLAGLGALHGLNPGMGWLFAVALGLQERRARAVCGALLPLAVGHALAIAATILPAIALGFLLPPGALRWLVATLLVGFAAYRLRRQRHPHFGGMRVGMRQLTLWSCLMASAHGAGLMVLPVLLPEDPAPLVHAAVGASTMHDPGGHAAHAQAATATGSVSMAILATAIHSAAYLTVTGLLAIVVYSWAGLALLRKAWINLDLIWIGALTVTAIVTLVM